MPQEAASDPSSLADPAFGFCFDGDFNTDGRRDRAAVGVYQAHSGEQGRFLLVLTESTPGRWEKAFLGASPPEPGFSVLWRQRGGVIWAFCMECDTFVDLVWTGTGYVLRGDEPDDTLSEPEDARSNLH
jgi:hypothetical protein